MQGELVAGFPRALDAVAPDADVISSSISSTDAAIQVSLTARTDASPDEVIAHFRAAWAGLGLTDTGGDSALSFADPYSSVTLGFTEGSGTGTVYVVYATLRVG